MIEKRTNNAKTWIFNLRDSLSHADFVKFSVMLWAIWSARRKAIHEGIFQRPLGTKFFVDRFLKELDLLDQLRSGKPLVPNHSISHVGRRNASRSGSWKRPPSGSAKCMVEAWIDRDKKMCV